jgi:hypothetical protein
MAFHGPALPGRSSPKLLGCLGSQNPARFRMHRLHTSSPGQPGLLKVSILGAFRKPVGVKPWLGHPKYIKIKCQVVRIFGLLKNAQNRG